MGSEKGLASVGGSTRPEVRAGAERNGPAGSAASQKSLRKTNRSPKKGCHSGWTDRFCSVFSVRPKGWPRTAPAWPGSDGPAPRPPSAAESRDASSGVETPETTAQAPTPLPAPAAHIRESLEVRGSEKGPGAGCRYGSSAAGTSAGPAQRNRAGCAGLIKGAGSRDRVQTEGQSWEQARHTGWNGPTPRRGQSPRAVPDIKAQEHETGPRRAGEPATEHRGEVYAETGPEPAPSTGCG